MKNPVSSKSPYIFPVSLVFFELAAYLSVDMYLPSMPRITSWFDTSEQWTKATLSSWLVGAGFFQLILGPISDRIVLAISHRQIFPGHCHLLCISGGVFMYQ